MIRLPKIFQKNSTSSTQDYSPRAYQKSSDAEASDSAVTEDPEKQKARHRLVGAAVLVLIAVIGLPKVFDSQPKKVNNDVVLQMVASVVEPPKGDEKKVPTESVNKVEEKVDPAAKTEVKPTAVEESKSKTTDKSNKPDKAAEKGLDKGEEIVEEVKPTSKDAESKVANNASKFILQIGAFSSQDRAKNWISKLKAEKIPTYTQERKKDDGTLYLLRAGPFKTRAEAEAAEKKARNMGLTPKIVESK